MESVILAFSVYAHMCVSVCVRVCDYVLYISMWEPIHTHTNIYIYIYPPYKKKYPQKLVLQCESFSEQQFLTMYLTVKINT